VRTDFGARLVKNPVVAKDGYLTPPEGPGLGVELDAAAVASLTA
jgi:L-alanine-DL-glutamate epimerase-like enolase superfamily enzyme